MRICLIGRDTWVTQQNAILEAIYSVVCVTAIVCTAVHIVKYVQVKESNNDLQ